MLSDINIHIHIVVTLTSVQFCFECVLFVLSQYYPNVPILFWEHLRESVNTVTMSLSHKTSKPFTRYLLFLL